MHAIADAVSIRVVSASINLFFDGYGIDNTRAIWGYTNNGTARARQTIVGEKKMEYKSGSTVKLVFDLDLGVLSALVDNGPVIQLIDGIVKTSKGYIPAVCHSAKGSKIELLWIE